MQRRVLLVSSTALLAATVVTSAAAAQGSPSPSTQASPYLCRDETTECAGPLQAGDHATVAFDVPFTFRLDDDRWINDLDRYRAYGLTSVEAPESEFQIYSHAAPEAQTDDCSPAREPGFGTSTSEWLRYLTTHPGLDVTEPVITDVGGRTLTSVVALPKATWTKTCPDNTDPVVLVVTDTEDPPTRRRYATGYMGFIDVDGEAIVIVADASGGDTLDAQVERVMPVIDSIRFVDSDPDDVGSPMPG